MRALEIVGGQRKAIAAPAAVDTDPLYVDTVSPLVDTDGVSVDGLVLRRGWVQDVRGPDLGDDNADIDFANGNWVVFPDGLALTTSRTYTVLPDSVPTNAILKVTLLGRSSVYQYKFLNGGPGGGYLHQPVQSQRYYLEFMFDGTNWVFINLGHTAFLP